MTAPIALYPDALLAQVLMASTYPLEVVQAERWLQAPGRRELKGEQLAEALLPETWDPSVKSLVPFPQVLQMMSERLDWTQRLGDAVLAQRKDVMESVQRLRRQAAEAGTLQSTEQQKVVTNETTVVIQPADPQTVYVPVYNPTTAYGTWPYPANPPVYYPPPPAYSQFGSAFLGGLGFGAGVAVVGSIWGWGDCDWDDNDINVNHETYNSINRTNIAEGRASRVAESGGNSWQFQPNHRGGVAYRDAATRQAYQRSNPEAVTARQQYRGRADTGTVPAVRSGSRSAGSQAGPLPRSSATRQSQSVDRRSQSVDRRSRVTAREAPAAFSGMQSGNRVAAQASRGQESRMASASQRGDGRGGGARGGGGGARGGGGGRR